MTRRVETDRVESTPHTPTGAHWYRRGTIDGRALASAWSDWIDAPRPVDLPAHWISRYVDPTCRLEPRYLDGLTDGWRA